MNHRKSDGAQLVPIRVSKNKSSPTNNDLDTARNFFKTQEEDDYNKIDIGLKSAQDRKEENDLKSEEVQNPLALDNDLLNQ